MVSGIHIHILREAPLFRLGEDGSFERHNLSNFPRNCVEARMASTPDPTQAKYDNLFRQCDLDKDGGVGLEDVIKFFSKLGSEKTRKIWTLVNPSNRRPLTVRI